MQHVLAGASSSGYTVVWDLRNKREVVALAYGGGAGTLAGQGGFGGGHASGGRRGVSAIAWHPDNVSAIGLAARYHCVISLTSIQATRLVTASEDDSSPIIMAWDLRNARAPEKVGRMSYIKPTNLTVGLDPYWARKRRPIPFMV